MRTISITGLGDLVAREPTVLEYALRIVPDRLQLLSRYRTLPVYWAFYLAFENGDEDIAYDLVQQDPKQLADSAARRNMPNAFDFIFSSAPNANVLEAETAMYAATRSLPSLSYFIDNDIAINQILFLQAERGNLSGVQRIVETKNPATIAFVIDRLDYQIRTERSRVRSGQFPEERYAGLLATRHYLGSVAKGDVSAKESALILLSEAFPEFPLAKLQQAFEDYLQHERTLIHAYLATRGEALDCRRGTDRPPSWNRGILCGAKGMRKQPLRN